MSAVIDWFDDKKNKRNTTLLEPSDVRIIYSWEVNEINADSAGLTEMGDMCLLLFNIPVPYATFTIRNNSNYYLKYIGIILCTTLETVSGTISINKTAELTQAQMSSFIGFLYLTLTNT